jgi:hypothetical protein
MFATIPHTIMLGLSLLSFVLSGVHVLLMLFVFLFTYTGMQRDVHFR